MLASFFELLDKSFMFCYTYFENVFNLSFCKILGKEDKFLNAVETLLLALILPPIVAFLYGINGLRRSEESIREFYWPLRDKFPREYVNQNRIIKIVRKWMRLKTTGTIHWSTCFFHYFQILLAISPSVMLIAFLITGSDQTVVLFLRFGFLWPLLLLALLDQVFIWIQVSRCKKIKKTDPKYANHEIYPWMGNHF